MSPQTADENAAWTMIRLLQWTTDHLARKGVDEARLASEVLLAHAAGCRRIDLYTRFDTILDEDRLDTFRSLVRRAATHEPVAHLVGQKEFFSLTFLVTCDTLIPRPETETVVECVVDHCMKTGQARPKLLDVGTGSGCLAITTLVQVPGATAVATDTSRAALAVARKNAQRHGVADQLTFLEADLLDLPGDFGAPGTFDLIMSNPPYVPAAEWHGLDPSVRDFEPHAALVSGEDGLSFYRAIAAKASSLLAPGGVIVVEVGDDRGPAVKDVMTGPGVELVHRATWKDRVVGKERAMLFGLPERDRTALARVVELMKPASSERIGCAVF